MTRRSTETVTVLSILSLVTRPVRTRLGIPPAPLRTCRGASFLREDGFHARDVAPYLAHTADAFGLAGRALEAQVELFALEIEQHCVEFVLGLDADVGRLGCLRHLTRLPCGRRSAS